MSSSTTVRTTRRRTLRVAAATLVAAAGLTLTACSGSDAASGAAKASGQTDTRPAAVGQQGAEPRTGAEPQAGAGAKAEAVGKRSGGSRAGTGKGASPVRTQPLPDGSKAEVYKLGDLHYRAKIVNKGSVLATFEANQRDAGLDANDMFVVLTMGGEVHSWMGGGHQGPGTFELAGGWTAKVTKVGELRYRAQILGREGAVYGTVEANGHDAGLDANGVYIVLSSGGVISAHQ